MNSRNLNLKDSLYVTEMNKQRKVRFLFDADTVLISIFLWYAAAKILFEF